MGEGGRAPPKTARPGIPTRLVRSCFLSQSRGRVGGRRGRGLSQSAVYRPVQVKHDTVKILVWTSLHSMFFLPLNNLEIWQASGGISEEMG